MLGQREWKKKKKEGKEAIRRHPKEVTNVEGKRSHLFLGVLVYASLCEPPKGNYAHSMLRISHFRVCSVVLVYSPMARMSSFVLLCFIE